MRARPLHPAAAACRTVTFARDGGQVLVRLFDDQGREVAVAALSPAAAAARGLDLAAAGLAEMAAIERGRGPGGKR